MKSTRSIALAILALIVVCGVARVVIPKRQAGQEATATDRTPRSSRTRSTVRAIEPPAARLPVQSPAPQRSPSPSAGRRRPEPVPVEAPAQESEPPATVIGPTTPAASPATPSTPAAPDAIQDLMARAALAYVGADADAEAYWYEAINDSSLSAHERQDLIEDLNEDGLSDPQNPTLDDLPLILNRIQLIEDVAEDAMDDVNAAAFQEAYKDLVNLALQVMGNN